METNNTSSSASELSELTYISSIVTLVRTWWPFTVIVIGVIGNLLTILVVSRRQNRPTPPCYAYFGALAACDTAMMLCAVGMHAVSRPGIGQLERLSGGVLDGLCKTFVFTSLSFAQSGVMIILALLAERCIAVSSPLDARVWLSARRACIVSVLLIVTTFLYNIPMIQVAGVNFNSSGIENCLVYRHISDLSYVYGWLSLFVNAVLPLVAILSMNTVILYKIKASATAMMANGDTRSPELSAQPSGDILTDDMDSRSPPPPPEDTELSTTQSSRQPQTKLNIVASSALSRKIAREKQLTVMTAIMTVVFLFLTVPKYAYFVVQLMSDEWEQTRGSGQNVAHIWTAQITWSMYVTNSASNFFIYAITGSKFRDDLKALFRCRQVSNVD